MNWPYLHLLTNHFPIMVTAFGIMVLVFALVTRRRAVWMYALATLAVAGLSAGPVYLTGSQAEETVEGMENAELAIWFLLGMGAISGYGFWQMRRAPADEQPRAWLRGVVAATALASMATITLTAQSGGKISHGDNTLMGKPSIVAPPPGPGDTLREKEEGGKR
jgi:hypothetical protein